MKYLTLTASGLLCLSLGAAAPSWGQTQAYINGPALPTNPTFQLPSDMKFSVDSNVSCPSPTFSVSAYGGNAYDRTNNVPESYRANGGSGNYGVAVGLSIPISGQLNQFCHDLAALRTRYEKLRVEATQLNNFVEVAQACLNLAEIFPGMRKDDPSDFYDNPQNSLLLPCREVVKQILSEEQVAQSRDQADQNADQLDHQQEQVEQQPNYVEPPTDQKKENEDLKKVEVTPVETWQEEPFRVQIINPSF